MKPCAEIRYQYLCYLKNFAVSQITNISKKQNEFIKHILKHFLKINKTKNNISEYNLTSFRIPSWSRKGTTFMADSLFAITTNSSNSVRELHSETQLAKAKIDITTRFLGGKLSRECLVFFKCHLDIPAKIHWVRILLVFNV